MTKKSKQAKEDTTITLKSTDCALVFSADNIELLLPADIEEQESVPEYFLFFIALTSLLEQQNKKLYSIVDKEIEKILKQVQKELEKGE